MHEEDPLRVLRAWRRRLDEAPGAVLDVGQGERCRSWNGCAMRRRSCRCRASTRTRRRANFPLLTAKLAAKGGCDAEGELPAAGLREGD